MKEIKFRAFLKNEGYTVDVLSIDFESELISHENIQTDNLLSTEPDSVVDPICFTEFEDIELIQFTGHKDKNRKEIYIGDILNWENECTILIKEKDELGFYYEVLTQKDKNVVSFDIRFYRSEESAEVIGNIFGNSELMEVKDERNRV